MKEHYKAVISPLLANIYLHYALDLWFEKRVRAQSTGYARIIRYADDFVVCFQLQKAKLRGHYAYYGVTDNFGGIKRFYEEVKKLLMKWMNRRGRKNCLPWAKFQEMQKRFPQPQPQIKVSMFPATVNAHARSRVRK